MSFFDELKRRNVFKVGIAYAVASWLLLQLTEVLTGLLEIGPEVGKIVIVLLIVGIVPTLIFAWAFEMTPEGIKREKDVDRTESITPQTGQKLNRLIIGMLVLVAGYFIWESRFMNKEGSEPFSQVSPQQIQVDEQEKREPGPATPAGEARKSIVVLPFLNMSNDPDQEFFSDGLSEEILNALVKIRDLRVISRTSAFAFKGKEMSIPEIAAQLGVSHVLEGSVRKAGNDVRITAQLIEVSSDSHLWSDAYNRSMENVFEIQEEISVAIANQLQVELGTGTAPDRPTDNIETYQMFLQGRHLYQNRGAKEVDQAINMLKRVVSLEPGYADAWANLAGASMVHAHQVAQGYEELVEQARHAATKALEADPENGFAHAVMGLLHMRAFQWEDALKALDRAIELNPGESNSLLWKGIFLFTLGYAEESIEYLLRAESVDPVFSLLQGWIRLAYTSLGDTEAVYRHSLKLRDFTLGSFTAGALTEYELLSGRLDNAEEEWAARDLESLDSDLLVRTVFAAVRDRTQQQHSIELLLANEEVAGQNTLIPYLWYLGATGEALEQFDKIIESGRGLRVQIGLVPIWQEFNREHINAPGLTRLFENTNVADYWRKHGDPDLCRVSGDLIECGDL